MTEVRKPSVFNAAEAGKKAVEEAMNSANQNIQGHETEHSSQVEEIAKSAETARTEAQAKKDKAIAESQGKLEEKSEVVRAAEEALRKAMEALDAAETEEAEAAQELKQTTKTLTKEFNQASKDIRKQEAAQKKEAKQAFKAKQKEEKAKVSEARKEAVKATFAEAGASVTYTVYKTADTTARTVNGVGNVFSTLGKAFNEGFEKDTSVKVPETIQKQKAQKKKASGPKQG